MNTKTGVGVSHHRNPKVAAKEALQKALADGNITNKPDFVFMFATVGYNQQHLVDTIAQLTDNAPLAGCSGEGIIAQKVADEGNFSVVIMAIKSDEIRFDNALSVGLKESSHNVGESIAKDLKKSVSDDSLGVITFSDGLTFNFNQFLNGLESGLNGENSLPVFGGTSADNWEMKQTFQYYNDKVVSDGTVAVLMSGSLKMAWAVNHGCVPIGTQRKITKCDGNIIYEIDNQPVLNILKEYLLEDEIDNWNSTVVNLSWGFKAPNTLANQYDEYIVRFMPAKDDKTGSITIPTEVVVGTDIWMTRRDQSKISEGLDKIANSIKSQMHNSKPKMVFNFDCAGRGKMIFREQQKLELLNSLQNRIGDDVPWIGLYTYGEIGPVNKINNFHNYTLVLLALY